MSKFFRAPFSLRLCAFLVTRRKSPYFSHLTSYSLLSARRRRAGMLCGKMFLRYLGSLMETKLQQPDALGHWGLYGGRFVPETLMAPLEELTEAFLVARDDQGFQAEL